MHADRCGTNTGAAIGDASKQNDKVMKVALIWGVGGFKAEPGRYHLYVSLACPWAHRTLIFRKLKGLTEMIDLSVVHWLMLENGWTFMDGPSVIPDPIHGARFL